MTTLFRSRQRAAEFAAHVDGTSAPSTATAPLVAVAELLRQEGASNAGAVPRESFTADLRERLLTEAARVLTPQNAGLALPVRTRGKRERRLVAVASAAVLIGGTAGMATAAQHALPGEALYPVKRAMEKVEVGLASGSAARGHDLLDQATGRLDEAQRLIADGSPGSQPQVPLTLDTFSAQARQGATLLMGSYRETGDPASIEAVRDFTAASLRSLEAMDAAAPAQAQPGLRDAALELRQIDSRAARLCSDCADRPALSLPPSFLASADVQRAIQRMQAARLDNSHPVPVLKQDLRGSGAGGSGRTSSRSPRTTGGTTTGGSTGGTGPAPGLPSAAPSTGPLSGPLSGLASVLPTSGPTPKSTPKAGSSSGDLGAGLGGAVETLLPDPTGLLP